MMILKKPYTDEDLHRFFVRCGVYLASCTVISAAFTIVRAWAIPMIAVGALILAQPAAKASPSSDYSAYERDAIMRDAQAGAGTGGYSASTGNMSYAYGGTLWRWFKALIWY